MTSSNIDAFNETAGKVFAALYKNFPMPIEIRHQDFIDNNHDSDSSQQMAESGSPPPSWEFIFSSIQWLINEGYISSRDLLPTQRHFRQVVLTQKGLSILNFTPNILIHKQSIGDRLVASAKAGAIDVLKSAAKEAFSVVIKSTIT